MVFDLLVQLNWENFSIDSEMGGGGCLCDVVDVGVHELSTFIAANLHKIFVFQHCVGLTPPPLKNKKTGVECVIICLSFKT